MILRARTILPVSRPPIENGAVVISENRVRTVGSWPDLEPHAGGEILACTTCLRFRHKEGSPATKGMLDAIDAAPPGSVYVMVLENGLDYAGMGALMATAMKVRGLTAAVIDGGVRDTPQIGRIQFPVFSRGIVPSTTINHFRFAGGNIPVTCAGVRVNPGDIIVGDEDGVAVVPRAHAAEVLKKAEEMDNTEHTMLPFIEKFKSIKEAVAKFGRI